MHTSPERAWCHPLAEQDFAVYTGGSITEVQAAYAAKHTAWCGWDHLLGTR